MKLGRWRHSKSGKEYTLLSIGKSSETLQELVVYQAEYGDRQVWVRPIEMWEQLVEVDGKHVPRFICLE